ncbi:class II fructose-bisphosphate aldolase [Enemella evansiae]|uniref:class II fructose-bisphosphate aldolase n=1 Tax=Enemella evansiae TaxID=2016499 RepID=UPI001E465C6E|nr:class II fructose-bisphosphate aldolase [Enemella evansiae]
MTTTMSEVLAGIGNGAVGAYNVILLEHAEAIAGAAADTGIPVVLQLSQNAIRYHGSLAPIVRACQALVEASPTPVVVHLDHIDDEELIAEGLELGVDSVMFDGSALDYADNVSATARVVERCHDAGCWVEAELGEVGGKDGVHAPNVRTDPDDAARFVTDTGVDALAVAVGSSHAMAERTAALDDELIAGLAASAGVPLVLHGSSGVPDDGLVSAVRHGIRKVNIGTMLNQLLTEQARVVLGDNPRLSDPRKYLRPGRDAIRAEVARISTLIGPHAG